jgi:hypothetical protein
MANKAILNQGGDGTAISAGMVGETITFTPRTVTGSYGAWAMNSTALATLTTGVWLVFGRISGFTQNNAASLLGCRILDANVTPGNGNVLVQHDFAYAQVTNQANDINIGMGPYLAYRATTNTPIYGHVFCEDAVVNVTISGFAIRIG